MLALDQRNDAITSIVGLAGAYIGDRYWVYADPVGAILVCTFVAWSWFCNAVEQVGIFMGYGFLDDKLCVRSFRRVYIGMVVSC